MRRKIKLSSLGSDRATAYPMSPKIARYGSNYLCTFLDNKRQNRWVVVDPDGGKIVADGEIGPPRRDNHCGGAVLNAPNGDVHVLVGAHHNEFRHYRLKAGAAFSQWEELSSAVCYGATYPSAVFDQHGMLHLTYRCRGLKNIREGIVDNQKFTDPYPYHIMHTTWSASSGWAQPVSLMEAAVAEHTWTMHGLTVDPSSRLHVATICTLTLPNGDKYYGGVHLTSTDAGKTWRQINAEGPLAPAISIRELSRIEGPGLPPERVEFAPPPPLPCGPFGSYYHQMVLSNPLSLQDGTVLVCLHNQLSGTIELGHLRHGNWTLTALPLANIAPPNFRFLGFSSVSQHRKGEIEAVFTIGPRYCTGFGLQRVMLLRYTWKNLGAAPQVELVQESRGDRAIWLPSLERSANSLLKDPPALLYTVGVNAANNYNNAANEVILEIAE